MYTITCVNPNNFNYPCHTINTLNLCYDKQHFHTTHTHTRILTFFFTAHVLLTATRGPPIHDIHNISTCILFVDLVKLTLIYLDGERIPVW